MNFFRKPKNPYEDVVTLRRSSRAKRLSLRVSSLDGRVTLTVPPTISEKAAWAFVREKADWIDTHRRDFQRPIKVGSAPEMLFEGRMVPVQTSTAKRATLSQNAATLEAPSDEAKRARAILAMVKLAARDRLAAACDGYALDIGRPYSSLVMRDTRSRWGSCSSGGRLMFSWRLVLAPPPVLQYVAAHEVAHLEHMDHSHRFWGLVGEICPYYEIHRNWLHENGRELHRWDFGD